MTPFDPTKPARTKSGWQLTGMLVAGTLFVLAVLCWINVLILCAKLLTQ